MSTVLIVIVILVVLFIVAAIAGTKSSKKAGQKAADLLREIDNKYAEFADQKTSLSIIENNELKIDEEEFAEKAFGILKPRIDGLIVFINKVNYSNVDVELQANYFQNVASYIEHAFDQSQENEKKELTKEQETEIYEAFKDAIKADITQRKLDARTGNII